MSHRIDRGLRCDMKIRTKAILVIVLTNLLIIVFSVSSGIIFVTRNNEESLEEYLSLTAELADYYLSSEIDNLKKDVDLAVQRLASSDEDKWQGILSAVLSGHEKKLKVTDANGLETEYDAGWVGITVFEDDTELVTAGNMPAGYNASSDKYKRQALGGETVISSTYQEKRQDIDGKDEAFIYIAKMVPATNNRIIVILLSGQYFSELLAEFKIWKTGHIFLSDAEGFAIGNPRASWVNTRFNYITIAEEDDRYAELADTVTLMTRRETGIGYYTIYDSGFSDYARACAYRPISASKEGWSLGVVAPLPENPFSSARTALLLVAVFSVLLNAVFAVFASRFIKKPFEEIVALKKVAETANTTKSSFLASMSHEIRTPMNAIIGMLELLSHEPLDSRQMNYVKDISHSATSLLTIINDILDMSKIESGKMELVPIDYDFLAFLDNMYSMFTYVAEEKGLEFKFEVESNAPNYLFGDDIRLRQVIVNICGNAVKFTEKGHVRLNVKSAEETLVFEISDTGRGIKQEDIGKLFSAFQQTDSVKNRGITGTGLGLAICKSFVELMGGAIMVKSEYGVGSTFTVTIPLVAGDVEKAKAAVVPKGRKLFAPKARVLVVDDNEFNLRVAVGLLNLAHIDAETAFSGMLAVEMVQKTDYHIVFMDHMMPEMDGVEATAAIRSYGGKYEQLPIVALTANAVQGAKEFFLNNGFNDFVSKPIDVREMVSVLEKWLPEELLESAPRDSIPQNEEKSGFLEVLRGIEDINVKIGLDSASGVENLYFEAVKLCCKLLPAECEKLSSSLICGDIAGFATSVHAMKSVLATIGSMSLSETALFLETAAKRGDAAACEEVFPGFHENLLNLQKKLQAAFPAEAVSDDRTPGDTALLREGIEKALAAADEYDNDSGFAAIEPLLAFDFGEATNGLLEAAAQDFKEFDCEKALQSLGSVEK